jgi:dolichol-phosphate mannosyltransferase
MGSHAILIDPPRGSLEIAAVPDSRLGAPVKLSLVIPTFNESKNIGPLIATLTTILDQEFVGALAGAYELIVVDDNSPDKTWEVAAAIGETNPRVRVVRRQGERGLSTAVIRGWQAARGEVLAVMDADLQHPPEVNIGLWREIQRGADLALGSRHIEGGGVSDWAFYRRVLSRGAQMLGLLILPGVLSRVSDPMSGYFMFKRSTLAGCTLDPLGYKILIEVLGRGNIKWVAEVGYVFRERLEGESKVSSSLYIDYLRHLVRLRLATLRTSRLFHFLAVGASGVLVDMGMLYLLSDPHRLGFPLTRSKLVAGELAIVWNFLLNDAWTFGHISKEQPGFTKKLRRFLGFNAICATGLAINVLILNLLFNGAHMNRYLANLIAIGLVTGWNYGLNRALNWAPIKTNDIAK